MHLSVRILHLLQSVPRPVTTAWLFDRLDLNTDRTTGHQYILTLFRRSMRSMVVKFRPERRGRGRSSYWTVPEKLPMTIADAQDMIRRGAAFGDVFAHVAPADQPAFKEWYVRTSGVPTADAIQSRKPAPPQVPVPTPTGDVCRCGGMLVRTGSCVTCQWCSESSGGCG